MNTTTPTTTKNLANCMFMNDKSGKLCHKPVNLPILASTMMPPAVDNTPVIHDMLYKTDLLCFSTFLTPTTGTILLELAASVATGSPWLGFPCTKGNALFISTMLNETMVYEYLNDLSKGSIKDTMTNLYIWSIQPYMSSHTLDADAIDNAIRMVSLANHITFDAIIIDPVYSFIPPTTEGAYQFFRSLSGLARKHNAAIIFSRLRDPRYDYELSLEYGAHVVVTMNKNISQKVLRDYYYQKLGDYHSYHDPMHHYKTPENLARVCCEFTVPITHRTSKLYREFKDTDRYVEFTYPRHKALQLS